ncbi:MAG: gliding motility-associated C-terminal domain-containing protein [Phycisphaerales bacterium]|nr:gliding motility-associated C-terminal domain-containing protein [Phycisphaerales bacterium]
MKKLSLNLLGLLTAVFVLFSIGNASANRAAAGEISYKWVSASTYKLTYTFYKDCGGATAEPNTVNLCYYNTCNTDKGNVSLTKVAPLGSNGLPVQNACASGSTTTCSSPAGTLRGYRKWVYEGSVTLPSACDSWHFIVSIGFRNGAITNYTVPGANNNLYTEATLNNVDAPTSSSPTFALDPIQYMCAGSKQSFDYSGTDADGDALSYSLIDPASAADNQVTCFIPPTVTSYVFGGALSGTSLATNPFLTTNTFNLSGTSGMMTFTPAALTVQVPQLALLVTKKRGTKVVGSVIRDMQFVISTGCAGTITNFALRPVPVSTGILIDPTGKGGQVCPNAAHHICFTIRTTAPGSTITVLGDNHLTFSPTSGTSTMTPYAGSGTDTVNACFDWTPNETDEGIKYLVIKSALCVSGNPLVYRLDTITIDIVKTVKLTTTDTFICLGEKTTICATPDDINSFNYETYPPGLPGGIVTSTGAPCTDVLPFSTMFFRFFTDSIPSFCPRTDYPALNTNEALIKIVVVNPKINAGPDTVLCTYDSLQLNGNLINPQPELTYKWRWEAITFSPGNWLSDTTKVNPVMRMPVGIDPALIPDSITYLLRLTPYPDTTCAKTDTVTVYILKGFYILTGDSLSTFTGLGHKGRQKGISDTSICSGKSITIQGWGDQRYEYIWTPAAGVSTPSAFVPGPGMTITPTATTTFSLTAHRNGCRDSTKKINITIESIPTVNIGPDRVKCFGDTANLEATINPDPATFTKYKYAWTPGGALSRTDTLYCYFTSYITETITMTVTTPAGCSGKDDVTIIVQPRKFLTPGADMTICPGDTAQISVTGDPKLKSVTWKPLINIDSIHSLAPKVWPPFSLDYVVLGVDSNRCIDSTMVKVTVRPNALIYLPDSVTIYPGETYQMDPQDNCLFHTWFPPIGLDNAKIARPKASPLLNTTYYLKGVTSAGCVANDSIYVFVAPDSYIDVPNAFTPGNSENATFKVTHLGDATLKSFTIYDRWGLKVFEGKDLSQGWDGSFGGQPQPYGVYVYVLEVVTAKGRSITKQGNVTLIR